jgi:hypothetical protein
VGKRNTVDHGAVVDEIFRGHLIGAIDDEIELLENVRKVVCRKALVENLECYPGIPLFDSFGGDGDLAAAEICCAVDDLPMQVGEVDRIAVNEAQDPHARGGQGEGGRAPETSNADDEHPAASQTFLLPHGCVN